MDPDVIFVLGLFIAIMAIPSIVSAWSDGAVPRVASVMLILGGAMMVWAHSHHVGGYRFNDIPDLIIRVVGKFI
ncbi:hypothetical protein [Thalassovita sp.]|jgi:uncharacterized membrane protein|uniref:hypothetical protein n=1 Tax=Thalassovita sp. TaxID=1979401 RepID=UPI003B5BDE9D